MAVCVLFGFAYLGWIAWTESWGFWIVASAVGLVFALGFVIHRLMDAARADRQCFALAGSARLPFL